MLDCHDRECPYEEWVAELGPYLPVPEVLGLGMGWVWGEEWQGMARQWHLHKFWGNYGGIYERGEQYSSCT